MNIKRFTAPTSREALAKARMAFGDGTLILSNRPTANGVEVVATAEDTLSALDGGAPTASSNPPLLAPSTARSTPQRASQLAVASGLGRNPVEEDTEQLAMSTLSFQDYVRERMLRRRHEALNGPSEPQTLSERSRDQEPERERMPAPSVARHNPLRTIPMDMPPEPPRRRQEAPSAHLIQSNNQQSVMNELHAMKELIEDRFNTLAWLGQARQNPIQSNLMLKMIRAGYSPSLARAVLERMPEDLSAGESVRWLMEVLERNLKTDQTDPPFMNRAASSPWWALRVWARPPPPPSWLPCAPASTAPAVWG